MSVSSVGNQNTIEQIIKESSKKASSRNTGELGKNDFLNLLVAQLRYQDPLKPMEDKEFIAQMAQFSSLEQMQNMNGNMNQSQAFSLIGKNVVATTSDKDTGELKTVEGVVTNVKVSSGKSYVVVNGEEIPVEKVTNVSEASKLSRASNFASYTNLIGYDVKGMIYDPNTSNVVGVQGVVKALEKGAYEDYAIMDGVELAISGIATDTPSTDPDFVENYLKERLPKDNNPGKQASVIASDSKNEQKVPVSGVLQSYKKENGKYIVTLNNVYVPVESVSHITRK